MVIQHEARRAGYARCSAASHVGCVQPLDCKCVLPKRLGLTVCGQAMLCFGINSLRVMAKPDVSTRMRMPMAPYAWAWVWVGTADPAQQAKCSLSNLKLQYVANEQSNRLSHFHSNATMSSSMHVHSKRFVVTVSCSDAHQ